MPHARRSFALFGGAQPYEHVEENPPSKPDGAPAENTGLKSLRMVEEKGSFSVRRSSRVKGTDKRFDDLLAFMMTGFAVQNAIARDIPPCKKCGCNWPAKDLRNGVCPNCRGENVP